MGLDCRIVCKASADDMPFFIMRYAATTVAERDQPMTQLTTTRPLRERPSSMKSVVRPKKRAMLDMGWSSTWKPK